MSVHLLGAVHGAVKEEVPTSLTIIWKELCSVRTASRVKV
jgi:hypothetical protein